MKVNILRYSDITGYEWVIRRFEENQQLNWSLFQHCKLTKVKQWSVKMSVLQSAWHTPETQRYSSGSQVDCQISTSGCVIVYVWTFRIWKVYQICKFLQIRRWASTWFMSLGRNLSEPAGYGFTNHDGQLFFFFLMGNLFILLHGVGPWCCTKVCCLVQVFLIWCVVGTNLKQLWQRSASGS